MLRLCPGLWRLLVLHNRHTKDLHEHCHPMQQETVWIFCRQPDHHRRSRNRNRSRYALRNGIFHATVLCHSRGGGLNRAISLEPISTNQAPGNGVFLLPLLRNSSRRSNQQILIIHNSHPGYCTSTILYLWILKILHKTKYDKKRNNWKICALMDKYFFECHWNYTVLILEITDFFFDFFYYCTMS